MIAAYPLIMDVNIECNINGCENCCDLQSQTSLHRSESPFSNPFSMINGIQSIWSSPYDYTRFRDFPRRLQKMFSKHKSPARPLPSSAHKNGINFAVFTPSQFHFSPHRRPELYRHKPKALLLHFKTLIDIFLIRRQETSRKKTFCSDEQKMFHSLDRQKSRLIALKFAEGGRGNDESVR